MHVAENLSAEELVSRLNMTIEGYLEHENSELVVSNLAAIVWCVVVMVVGSVGNGLVIYSYYFFSTGSSRYYILTMACYDFTVCSVIMPFNVHTATHLLTYRNEALCVAYRTVESVFVVASVFMLAVIALDRYIRVCHPFCKINSHTVKMACVSTLLLACLHTLPASFVAFGIKRMPTSLNKVYGYRCRLKDGANKSLLFQVYNASLGLFFLLILGLLVTAYVLVWRSLILHRRNMRRRASAAGTDVDTTTTVTLRRRPPRMRGGVSTSALPSVVTMEAKKNRITPITQQSVQAKPTAVLRALENQCDRTMSQSPGCENVQDSTPQTLSTAYIEQRLAMSTPCVQSALSLREKLPVVKHVSIQENLQLAPKIGSDMQLSGESDSKANASKKSSHESASRGQSSGGPPDEPTVESSQEGGGGQASCRETRAGQGVKRLSMVLDSDEESVVLVDSDEEPVMKGDTDEESVMKGDTDEESVMLMDSDEEPVVVVVATEDAVPAAKAGAEDGTLLTEQPGQPDTGGSGTSETFVTEADAVPAGRTSLAVRARRRLLETQSTMLSRTQSSLLVPPQRPVSVAHELATAIRKSTSRLDRPVSQTTLSFIVVSVVFFLSFFSPMVMLILGKGVTPVAQSRLQFATENLIIRTTFVQNVANPFIYLYFNDKFREVTMMQMHKTVRYCAYSCCYGF